VPLTAAFALGIENTFSGVDAAADSSQIENEGGANQK
jgi:hypothetical protein